MTEEFVAQLAQVRAALPPNRSHVDPKEVERVVFGTVGHHELGLRIWTEAREAAEQAWKDCRTRMRSRYGARSPRGGWLMFVLFAAVLCGAFAAVLASGFRTDPQETKGVLAALVIAAATADVVALAVAGWRPLNRAAIRMQIGIGVTLGAAAAFQLTRPSMAVTPVAVAGGTIGLAGLLLVLLVRAALPAERLEIDTAINVAVAEMQPEVDAIGARIQAQALEELGEEDQARIVALRTALLADLATEGLVFDPVPEGTPAGGVIISALLSRWHPYAGKVA